jgi:hypothetical protein
MMTYVVRRTGAWGRQFPCPDKPLRNSTAYILKFLIAREVQVLREKKLAQRAQSRGVSRLSLRRCREEMAYSSII